MQTESALISVTLTATATLFKRVVVTTGALAGIADWYGMAVVQSAGVSGDTVLARTVNAQGTLNVIASEAIAVGDPCYSAASGKVSKTSGGGAILCGVARTSAAADGDQFELIPV